MFKLDNTSSPIKFRQRVKETVKDQRDALRQIVEDYPDLKKITDLDNLDDNYGGGRSLKQSRPTIDISSKHLKTGQTKPSQNLNLTQIQADTKDVKDQIVEKISKQLQ